jgi:hypothetical protein
MSELSALCAKLKITADSTYGGVDIPEGLLSTLHPYKVTLKFGRRRLTVPFFQGYMADPTAASVLYCLCTDARAPEVTFEEFCGEFGYDVDSRKAEKIYLEGVAMSVKVKRFLGDSFDDVANAEH